MIKRSARSGARVTPPLITVTLAAATALALAGCAGTPPAGSSPAAANGPSLVVIQEDDAAHETAQSQTAASTVPKENEAEANTAQTPEDAKAALDQAVAAIEAKGITVAYVLSDLATGKTIEYNADEVFYSASSVKGLYCVSLLRAMGSQVRGKYDSTIRACLVNSDNDAYRTLRKTFYGKTFFRDFGAEAGVDIDLTHWYSYYSVRDLANLWAVADRWLTAGSDDAAWVGGLLGNTLNSQVDDCAGGDGINTWSKAGWFSGGGESPVTIDGGAVHTDTGDYTIAVAVNRGSDFKAIKSVMEPLIAVYRTAS